MVIVRVTLFRAKAGQAEKLVRQLAENVREVRAVVPDVIDIVTGPKVAGNAEYDCAIVAKYPSRAALDAYDVHPAHIATRARMEPYVAERHALVLETPDE